MSLSRSPVMREELNRHVFRKYDGDISRFPRCGPCGKYCTCVLAREDDQGLVHRHVCCRCASRPPKLWLYPLKRVMCSHAPPYDQIPMILEMARDLKNMKIEQAPRIGATTTITTTAEKMPCVETSGVDDPWEDGPDTREEVETGWTSRPEKRSPRTVFVDVQCFKDDENEFIPKELAAVELTAENSIKTLLWTTVRPPYDFTQMDDKTFEQLRYLSERYHGLSWEEGTLNADDAFRLLRAALFHDFAKTDVLIFVKGEEKSKYIQTQIPDGRIVEFGGPSLKRMHIPDETPQCPVHSKKSGDYTCSLVNCYRIAAHHRSSQQLPGPKM